MSFIAILFLGACSSADMSFNDGAFEDPTDTDGPPPGTLRVDVTPASDELNLLPQSFEVSSNRYTGQNLALTRSINVFGTLDVLTYAGWGIAPPSEQSPLVATVSASRRDAIQAGADASEITGRETTATFSFEAPADPAYLLSLVPADATEAPFLVWPAQRVMDDLDFTQLVEPGAPVYGRVVDASGAPVGRVNLTIERADVGVSSSVFTTDEEGWFLARVEPGQDYVLHTVSELRGGVAHPAVDTPFTVSDELGVEVNVNLGSLETGIVTGHVIDAEGENVPDALVRATSRSLDGSDARYDYSVSIQGDGAFNIELLPGEYDIEIIPLYATGLTPRLVSATVDRSGVDLGALRLDESATFSGTVRGTDGAGVPNATVTLQEDGFDGYTWNTATEADGSWSISGLPSLRMTATVSPADPQAGAITRVTVTPDEAVDVRLTEGELVSGLITTNGAPVPYALVEVRDASTLDVVGRTLADADGNYALQIDPALLSTDTTGETGDTGTQTETGDTAQLPDTGDTGDTAAGDTGDTTDSGSTGDTGGSDTGA